MTTHGGRLPAETSRFFGRSDEAAAIRDALARSRLVTLTGPGGIGKTRLAVKVAGELAHGFGDGVFLADLSAARDPGDVARTVTAALGLPGRDDQRDGPGRLGRELRGRRLLLILDTCEHVVDACAALAEAVWREGGPVLLVTSRQPLGRPGEVVFRIPPLAVRDAVSLLADRAEAAATGFTVTEGTLPKLARLARLLDGSPLAIELAALRLRAVSLDQLLVAVVREQGAAPRADLDDARYAGCWARLTAREREVALLVALGLTSKDIAARLVVSKRTVDSHLEHILGKLGYNSRVQVAALAAHEQARQQRDRDGVGGDRAQ